MNQDNHDHKQLPPTVPDKKSGIRFFFSFMRRHIKTILLLNLLLLVFLLPLVTLPGALIAANRVFIRLLRSGRCNIRSEFKQELLSVFWPRFLIYIAVMAIPILLSLWPLLFHSDNDVLLIAAAGVALVYLSYFFTVSAMLMLPATECAKRACYLMLLEWPSSAMQLLLIGGFYLINVFLFPYSLPMLLSVGLSLPVLAAALFTEPLVDAHFILGGRDKCSARIHNI